MLTKEKIVDDLKQSMLAKDELKTSVIRMLKAELMKIETDGSGREINDEIIQDSIRRMLKQRKDSHSQFIAGNRPELAAKEELEMAILQAYLPEQMSEAEVEAVVKETMLEMSVTDKSGMGKLMGAVMNKLKGKTDGSVVKKMVEKQLI